MIFINCYIIEIYLIKKNVVIYEFAVKLVDLNNFIIFKPRTNYKRSNLYGMLNKKWGGCSMTRTAVGSDEAQ